LVVYLAGADVALSVCMTLCSTLLAVGMTPGLMKLLAGAIVAVDAGALLASMLQITVLPLVLGVLLRRLLPNLAAFVRPVLPLLSTFGVVLVCAAALAGSAPLLSASASGLLVACVAALHFVGFGLGYLVARLAGVGEAAARAVAVEVGMQNSGMGAALAAAHFACSPATAAPAAVSASMHSVMGSALAALWRWRDARRRATMFWK